MIRNDLVDAAAEAAGLPRPKATQAVEAILEVMLSTLARGDRIELRGFGVFQPMPKRRGIGRNPKHPTEEVAIPPGLRIRFKPGKGLHDIPLLVDPQAGGKLGH